MPQPSSLLPALKPSVEPLPAQPSLGAIPKPCKFSLAYFCLIRTAVGALLLVLGACTNQSIFKAVDAQDLAGRKILFLHLQSFFAKDSTLQVEVMNLVEKKMAALPYIDQGFITRQNFLRQHANNLSILRVYNAFSLLLAGSMLPNREQSILLANVTKATLLSGVQVEVIDCANCQDGNQVWLVGQLLDAKTGTVLLRAHLSRGYSGKTDARKVALALAEEWLELLHHYTRPKWHQQRFKHLQTLASQ